MKHKHGDFALLKNGVVQVYSSDYHAHIVPRLTELYAKDPSSEYLITQVVGTVDKPKGPVIHSVYNTEPT